jgi:hypothetical protein
LEALSPLSSEAKARPVLSNIGPSHQTTQLMDNPTAANTHTETFHFNLIRLGEDGGSGDDLRTGAVFHFTLNANGELTAFKFDFTVECN